MDEFQEGDYGIRDSPGNLDLHRGEVDEVRLGLEGEAGPQEVCNQCLSVLARPEKRCGTYAREQTSGERAS